MDTFLMHYFPPEYNWKEKYRQLHQVYTGEMELRCNSDRINQQLFEEIEIRLQSEFEVKCAQEGILVSYYTIIEAVFLNF